jgi:hypothetical protein
MTKAIRRTTPMGKELARYFPDPEAALAAGLDDDPQARDSAEDPMYRRKHLKHAPSKERRRGLLAAGLMLSLYRSDGNWGLCEEPDLTVTSRP